MKIYNQNLWKPPLWFCECKDNWFLTLGNQIINFNNKFIIYGWCKYTKLHYSQ